MKFGIGITTCTLLLIISLTSVTFAASNSFPIKALVGSDTEAPTTPTLVSVVPVAPLQINIVWSTVTDNVLVAGYRLFRDGIQIATTTQTTFNDTGLTPLTLYSYTVDAFDPYENYSSSSVAVATTTLALPVIPPTATTSTGSTEGTSGTLVSRLDTFEIRPAERSAFFTWKTNSNTRYTLQWGRTTSYEIGTVSTNIYNQAHETTLENLEPGTHYWYSLVSTNGRGVSQITKQGDFMTLPVVQTLLPSNVSNVVGVARGTDVLLRWQNPVLPPGASIRVLRSHLFYPLSATDGVLVYEGRGSSVTDRGALAGNSPQYYTIFVVTETGLLSSGAVVKVAVATIPATGGASTATSTTPLSPTESGSSTVLRASSVLVRQGIVTQALDHPLTLDFDQSYILYIPVDAVTTHLKSIIVTVQDPTDQRQSTSYLLRLNQAGDAYAAVIEAPHVGGASRAIVEVFDFNQASVRKIVTPIQFSAPTTPPVMFPDNLFQYGFKTGLVALVIAFAMLSWWRLIFLLRREREDKS